MCYLFNQVLFIHYSQSTHPMGDLVPSMQHVHLTHTFIWAMYRQLTALYTQKIKK